MRARLGRLVIAFALFATAPHLALGGENLETERLLSDVIQQSAMERTGELSPSQGWAILPQIGYSPEKGPNAGIKFTDRNATAARMTIDLEGSYALKRQQNASVAVLAPHLFDDRLIAAFEGR